MRHLAAILATLCVALCLAAGAQPAHALTPQQQTTTGNDGGQGWSYTYWSSVSSGSRVYISADGCGQVSGVIHHPYNPTRDTCTLIMCSQEWINASADCMHADTLVAPPQVGGETLICCGNADRELNSCLDNYYNGYCTG